MCHHGPMSNAAPQTCDSCGRDDEPLVEVRRLYLTPETWEGPATTSRAAETERWCTVCLTHYPHESV